MPPPLTSQTDPESPRPEDPANRRENEAAPATPDQPLTFVPHDANGAVATEAARIRTSRHGELEAHELVKLLDTIEDERARGRFRESIYISVIFWAIVAWFVIYGPRVLWHAPRVQMAKFKNEELTTLNAPVLPHAAPVVHPPTLDNHTLERLREMTRRETPPPPTPQPQPPAPAPAPAPAPPVHATPVPQPPLPAAPEPQRRSQPVPEAPTPQPSSHPNFNTGTPEQSMNEIMRESRGGGSRSGMNVARTPGGGASAAGSTIISDTEGVDFSDWKRRFDQGTIDAWIPLLPEEIQPPLMKKGETYLILTVNPDGSIGGLKLEASSRDEALDRAAWGSIISQGRLPPLPKAFHGPNIVLRLHYMVNETP